ncbi:hypothetical protein FGO68_gene7910 [Halteria grandinella]|uniref:Uncharacterized protein n=1 Tax=Halteria grandinella TaxID=5974 RepID=A0A8J8NWM4_HALGN|nr:hypothetical protein FGO68_gene7910 [Halteria grandinella]
MQQQQTRSTTPQKSIQWPPTPGRNVPQSGLNSGVASNFQSYIKQQPNNGNQTERTTRPSTPLFGTSMLSQRMDKSIMSSYRDNPEIKGVMNHEMNASFTSRNVVAETTGKKMINTTANSKPGASECLNWTQNFSQTAKNSPLKQERGGLNRTLKLEPKTFSVYPQTAVTTPIKQKSFKSYQGGSFLFHQPVPVQQSTKTGSSWGKKNQSPGLSKILASTATRQEDYNDDAVSQRPSKRVTCQTSNKMQEILQIEPLSSSALAERRTSHLVGSVASCPLDANDTKKKHKATIKLFEGQQRNKSSLYGIVGGGANDQPYSQPDGGDRERSRSKGSVQGRTWNGSSFDLIKGDANPPSFVPKKKLFTNTDPFEQPGDALQRPFGIQTKVEDDVIVINPKHQQPLHTSREVNRSFVMAEMNESSIQKPNSMIPSGFMNNAPQQAPQPKVAWISSAQPQKVMTPLELQSPSKEVIEQSQNLTQDHKKAVFMRKNQILEQNKLLVAHKILNTNDQRRPSDFSNSSFAELLKEDYSKKNFNQKQRKMQEILDMTAKHTFEHPDVRDVEKKKLLPSANQSLIESFTGDHKLNTFVNEKLPKTEKTKLKLSDYLVKTTNAQDSKKKILQEQEIAPMLEDNLQSHLDRSLLTKSFTEDVKAQIQQKSQLKKAERELDIMREQKNIGETQRKEQEEMERLVQRKMEIRQQLRSEKVTPRGAGGGAKKWL